MSYRYAYNANGELEKQYVDGGRVYDFEYDSLGRLIRSRESENNGTLVQRTEHMYDNANRLISQSWQFNDGDSYKEEYTYDSTDGKLTSQTTVQNSTITLSYDALKRLSTQSVTKGTNSVYSTSYTYRNIDSNRTTLQVSDLTATNAANTQIMNLHYNYNIVGDITSVTSGGNTLASYVYDDRQQLTTGRRYYTVGGVSMTDIRIHTYDTYVK